MNKPTEKSSSESRPQTASGAPTREESNCAHTRSTSNAVALHGQDVENWATSRT